MERVRAWRPELVGVSEVLHAHFTEHSYPAHVHDQWTVLLVDKGGVDGTSAPCWAPPGAYRRGR